MNVYAFMGVFYNDFMFIRRVHQLYVDNNCGAVTTALNGLLNLTESSSGKFECVSVHFASYASHVHVIRTYLKTYAFSVLVYLQFIVVVNGRHLCLSTSA